MASITIKDLRTDRVLDSKAMSAIKGGDGAPWVFGWIRPWTPPPPFGAGSVINFYQINNYADQMTNQIQMVDVTNTGANSNINIAVAENSANTKH